MMSKFRVPYLFATLLCAPFLFVCCIKENSGGVSTGSDGSLGIVSSIYEGEGSVITKAADTDGGIAAGDAVDPQDTLRESFFSTLDIFVKESAAPEDAAWFNTWHLSASDAGVTLDPDRYDSKSLLDKARQWLSDSWGREGFVPGKKYDIYVAANNPHTAEGDAPANLAGLKALETYEHNIFRYYKNAPVDKWDSHMRDEKQFLMDGSIKGWQVDTRSKEQVFNVDLKRASAKIIVNIKYGDEKRVDMVSEDGTEALVGGELKDMTPGTVPDKGSIKEYFDFIGREPGVPRWKYVNFGFRVADIGDGSFYPNPYDSGIGDHQEAVQTYSSTFDTEKLPAFESSPNIDSRYSIVTYSYPVGWNSDPSTAPCLLLSVAYTKKDNPSDYKINYYRIPVCDETAVTSLERNHIYIVDVDIASLGSSSSPLDIKDEQLRIEYHVIPWTEENVAQYATTTVQVSDTKYLLVTPTSYTLKGNDRQNVNLQWYASVSKDDGRIVDIDQSSLKVSYVNYLGETVDITGSISKSTLSDGTIQLASTAPTSTAHGEQVVVQVLPSGIIRVFSDALASRAVKDISFTVKLNTTTLSEDVSLRHFPLDNIQSIEGWWSSKVSTEGSSGTVKTSSASGKKLEFSDTNPGSGWTRYYQNGKSRWYREINATVEQVTTRWILYDQSSGQRGQVISQGIFTAKVMNFNGRSGNDTRQIVAISNPSTNNSRPGMAAYSSSFSSLTNNQMYVIQTTATSDKFAIGKPVLDWYYQSEDKCVSPAFMIASQLGAVTATNSASIAAQHCGTYMEVGVDGTHYTGWRLPTGAEIGAILDYQNNPDINGETIVEVLGGDFYWALDGRAYSKANGTYSRVDGSNYVRCVRDLTLDEVKKLNRSQE